MWWIWWSPTADCWRKPRTRWPFGRPWGLSHRRTTRKQQLKQACKTLQDACDFFVLFFCVILWFTLHSSRKRFSEDTVMHLNLSELTVQGRILSNFYESCSHLFPNFGQLLSFRSPFGADPVPFKSPIFPGGVSRGSVHCQFPGKL